MYIKPGVDYLTEGRTSAADIQADLDAAFASVKELSMNTVILPLTLDGKCIAQKSGLPYVDDTLEFDILEYASQKARENGLYIYVIYDLFTGVQDGSIVELSQMDSASISDTVDHGLAIAQNYDIEGLMVDSYYNETQENSYLNYKLYGGGMGYENYMSQQSHTAFRELSEAIRTDAPGKQIGMLTVPVWANSSTDENGSDTTASYTAKYSGNADNLSYLEDGYVDFVVVKAEGSTTDANIPYKKVVSWWGEQADARGMRRSMCCTSPARPVRRRPAGPSMTSWRCSSSLRRISPDSPGICMTISPGSSRTWRAVPRQSWTTMMIPSTGSISSPNWR